MLAAIGVDPGRIHVELFNGSESMTPGVVGTVTRAPHLPKEDAGTGLLVSFARSGIAAHWDTSSYGSLLELAEAWGEMGAACSDGGLDMAAIEAMNDGTAFQQDANIETVARLQMELAALAFACNATRVATAVPTFHLDYPRRYDLLTEVQKTVAAHTATLGVLHGS